MAFHIYGPEELVLLNVNTTQAKLQIQATTKKITHGTFLLQN